MASIDLNTCSQKPSSLRDIFCRRIFEFARMPNGHGSAMRIFTKFSKISFSILREKGFLSVVYAEDSYFQDDDYKDCFSSVLNTIEILRYLGFTIHSNKSSFIPPQCITYLFPTLSK